MVTLQEQDNTPREACHETHEEACGEYRGTVEQGYSEAFNFDRGSSIRINNSEYGFEHERDHHPHSIDAFHIPWIGERKKGWIAQPSETISFMKNWQ